MIIKGVVRSVIPDRAKEGAYQPTTAQIAKSSMFLQAVQLLIQTKAIVALEYLQYWNAMVIIGLQGNAYLQWVMDKKLIKTDISNKNNIISKYKILREMSIERFKTTVELTTDDTIPIIPHLQLYMLSRMLWRKSMQIIDNKFYKINCSRGNRLFWQKGIMETRNLMVNISFAKALVAQFNTE